MTAPTEHGVVSVPEIRDYERINAELKALLDAGRRRVRLAGVDGQRLLLFGFSGSWDAVVELDGTAGPELAAELDAPNLTVVCRGGAADGAGRGLRQGRVLILGDAGDATGYAQAGGELVIKGSAGHRTGLAMTGGTLVVLGDTGRLAGERQTGGRIFCGGRLGAYAGRGRRGGSLILIDRGLPPGSDPRAALEATLSWVGSLIPIGLSPWLAS